MSSPQMQTRNAIDVGQVIQIAQQLPTFIALFQQVLALFHRPKPSIPEPPATPAPPPVPGTPAPVPIPQVRVRKVGTIRALLQKAERPDMSVTPRRHDPGNLYPDPMGMVARNEAFNYGASFWLDGTLYDEHGDPIEDQEIVESNLEFRCSHEIYRDGQIVAYIRGEGDDNPTGEGSPAPYHTWSIDGIRVADTSWRRSAGLNARFQIDIEGTFEMVVKSGGVESNRFTLRTS